MKNVYGSESSRVWFLMTFPRKSRKQGVILMLPGSQTDTEAAALYWRPNLRLAVRPGRVQGGEGGSIPTPVTASTGHYT